MWDKEISAELNDQSNKKLSEKAKNVIYKKLSYYYFYTNHFYLFNHAFIIKVFSLVINKKTNTSPKYLQKILKDDNNWMYHISDIQEEVNIFNKILKKEFPKMKNAEQLFEESALKVSKRITPKTVKGIYYGLDEYIHYSYSNFMPYFTVHNNESNEMFELFEEFVKYIDINIIRKKVDLEYVEDIVEGEIKLSKINETRYNFIPSVFINTRKSYKTRFIDDIISELNLYYEQDLFSIGLTFIELTFTTYPSDKDEVSELFYSDSKILDLADLLDFLKSKQYPYWKEFLKDGVGIETILNSIHPDKEFVENEEIKEMRSILKKNKTEEEKLYIQLKYDIDF